MKLGGFTVRISLLLLAASLVSLAPVYAQQMPNVDSEKFLFRLADNIQRREAAVGFSRLSVKEQTFYLIWSLEAEVNNGGFDQFFFNSSGDHASATAGALRAIGAARTALLVDQAISIFGPKGPSGDKAERRQQLMLLSKQQQERLADLDARFYAYPDNLSELLANYMRSAK